MMVMMFMGTYKIECYLFPVKLFSVVGDHPGMRRVLVGFI
jgi:hypothetical protein